MRLAVAIGSVPSRAPMATDLVAQLGGATRVYVDEPPSGGAWNNYRRMLSDAGRDGEDWLVGLDDDAVLCANFRESIARALESLPSGVDFASFYFGNRRVVAAARAEGASWVRTLRVVHGICWAIKPAAATECVRVVEESIRPGYKPGDQRLLAWLALTGRHNYASVPSLVDHRQDAASVMANTYGVSNEGVRAALFAPNASAVVWSAKCYAHRDTQGIALERLYLDDALRDGVRVDDSGMLHH